MLAGGLDRKYKIRQTIIDMKGILSKISIIFFFFLLLLFFSASQLLAQTKTTQLNNSPAVTANSDVPNNLHNWTQRVMIEVMSSLSCQLTGIDPTTPSKQCLGFNQKTGKIGFLPAGNLQKGEIGGAIGGMTSMISMLYTPPLHTSDYFQNLAQNFGITKKTYAQHTGTGFDSLSPLMNIWTTFRNIVYLFLVVIFVVIGLAIMLRIKIDPRTVMTVQNQIPKIIVGILLVTFSFAIAGFLVDLMWVSIFLVYNVISGTAGVGAAISNLNPSLLQGKTAIEASGNIATGGVFGIATNITYGLGDVFKNLIGVQRCDSIANCLNAEFNPLNFIFHVDSSPSFNPIELLYNLISWYAGGSIFWNISHVPTGGTPLLTEFITAIKNVGAIAIGGLVSVTTQYLLREWLPTLIIYLIVFLALVVALFRLWFTLLMAYVSILLDVVLAPFWIIGGIVPGSPISFSGWLKDIGANLLAFPVTIFMFIMARVFMDSFGSTSSTNFVPPLIGNPGSSNLIGFLIAFGIILMTPNVVNMLKQMLKAPKMDTGLGKAFSVGPALLTNTGRGIGGTFASADEFIMKDVGGGKHDWGRRDLPRAIFGRLIGRG